ncbi:hypothetical protein [Pseudobdellovibrio exovorus]|uniref:Uncharacterized protein n=1 Tax=Pseudobdellovibrio exovorus JSS TaxID=1184267 RepID=M4V7L2_9BACT|nr:hypothetical protein [Pseudobdellovibrio exovorus]AGH95387.1 hypothetical protein A11Q_1171 [Pseudobdellovibrio exovorus JSS]
MIENTFNLAEEVDSCIAENRTENEPKIIEKIINKIEASKNKTFKSESNNVSVSVAGDYLHGHRSQCKFHYWPEGKIRQKELCDLMVVSCLVENDKLLSLKASFVQAKKGDKKTRSYKIDPVQLYLLKDFPEITPVGRANLGTIPIKFQNSSHTLGSYLLFTPTLEFIWTTAKIISLQMSSSKNLKASALNPYFANSLQSFFWHPYWARYNLTTARHLKNQFDIELYKDQLKDSCELALSSSRDFFNYLINHRLGQEIEHTVPDAKIIRLIIDKSKGLKELKTVLQKSGFGGVPNENSSDENILGDGIGIIASITTIGAKNE